MRRTNMEKEDEDERRSWSDRARKLVILEIHKENAPELCRERAKGKWW